MKFMIYSDIPDECILDLNEALNIISENKHYSQLKKVDSSNIQELVCAYVGLNLYNIYKDYSKVKYEK